MYNNGNEVTMALWLGVRDHPHIDSFERWALFVRENPGKWKQIHTEFIDAQFIKSEEFYRRLARTKEGRQKIREISGIRRAHRQEGYWERWR